MDIKCEDVVPVSDFAYFMRLNETGWRFVLSQFDLPTELAHLFTLHVKLYDSIQRAMEAFDT